MTEESVVTLAEVVEPRFSAGRMAEPVFGAFAVAGEEILARAALLGQPLLLDAPEGCLLLAIEHLYERMLVDVSQFVLREYEVVAGIHVAVELHHCGMATACAHAAYAWRYSHPVGQRSVEDLYEVGAHILFHPLIEDGNEEVAPLFWTDRKVGQPAVVIVMRAGQPSAVLMRLDAFHDWCELQVMTAYLLEEVVDIERIVGVVVVDHRHSVPLHTILVQQSDAFHHFVERWQSLLVPPIGVVKLLWSVY